MEDRNMKELKFDNLYPPEYYHEIPRFDSRIAIRKFLDAQETMSFARISLEYVGENQTNEFEKNYMKLFHLRHSIEDLNSTFDLLLQIPWMYYRAWQAFNRNGSLHTKKYFNKNDIVRSKGSWVHKAEEACTYNKLMRYLESTSSPLKEYIESFANDYVWNDQKKFTIRTLCNGMKHNHVLCLDELYKPYEFNINLESRSINLRKENLRFEGIQEFYDADDTSKPKGKNLVHYENDIKIDIEYADGEKFRFIDCTQSLHRYKLLDVLNECENFYDAMVTLFDDVYKEIYPNILRSVLLNDSNEVDLKKNTKFVDLNKYLKVIE